LMVSSLMISAGSLAQEPPNFTNKEAARKP
jgi:hypothetical protein